MSPAAVAAGCPTVAEICTGDAILAADDKLPFVVIVRRISTTPGGRVLHLEVPGLPQHTWPVEYFDTERVERHARRAA